MPTCLAPSSICALISASWALNAFLLNFIMSEAPPVTKAPPAIPLRVRIARDRIHDLICGLKNVIDLHVDDALDGASSTSLLFKCSYFPDARSDFHALLLKNYKANPELASGACPPFSSLILSHIISR